MAYLEHRDGKQGGDSSSLSDSDFFTVFSAIHMVEDPVPDDEHPGDDHAGQQSCTGECEVTLKVSFRNTLLHPHYCHSFARDRATYPATSRFASQ
ncbi:MAG: hypothetical protein WC294_08230 [Methanoregula sp.]|jgi:hypothetical protein